MEEEKKKKKKDKQSEKEKKNHPQKRGRSDADAAAVSVLCFLWIRKLYMLISSLFLIQGGGEKGSKDELEEKVQDIVSTLDLLSISVKLSLHSFPPSC